MNKLLNKRYLQWLVAVAFFMESLDITILNTAVPTIAQTLNVVPLSMKAVLASYTLSLAAAFIPNRFHVSSIDMIHGIHKAFLIVGALTILSSLVFFRLRRDDGETVSQHKAL